MRLRRTGNFLMGMLILLVSIALALGVLLVGIAVMIKEPQAIVLVGTPLLCLAIVLVGLVIAQGDFFGVEAASERSEGSGPSPEG